jgi:hypothetical protein
MITYPTNRLLGVIDRPDDAPVAVQALLAARTADAVELLVGDDGLERLSRLGPPSSPLSRIIRAFQFMTMDQTPDFLVYERALLDGRAVVAVRVSDRERMRTAADLLTREGAHFLNYFGRYMTEEVSLWRGPEPEIPDALRR